MPSSVQTTAAAGVYAPPMVNRDYNVLHVKVDMSALTTTEVDSQGYIKPGLPLTINGLLVGAANTARVGVVPHAVKVAEDNTTLASMADPFIAVEFGGTLNRDVAEDNLGRALSANEIAGLNGVSSNIVLALT